MRESFEKLAVAGKIQSKQIKVLVRLAECKYCTHKSWGFGEIKEIDPVLSRFLIDFENKKAHSMDLAFGAKTLTPLSEDHILVRKAKERENEFSDLREMAALHRIDLIKLVIESFGGSATVAEIQAVLVPDVIADDWRKWWEGVRKELKKDGHFSVPIKKSEPIIYDSKSVSLEDRLMSDFREARGLKARLAITIEMIRNSEDLSNKSTLFQEACAFLNDEIAKHCSNNSALALEGIFARDDLCRLGGFDASPDQIGEGELWKEQEDADAIIKIFESLPAARHRRALESYKSAFPKNSKKWRPVVLDMMNSVGARLAGECARLLIGSKFLKATKSSKANSKSSKATKSSKANSKSSKATKPSKADSQSLKEFKERLARLINQHQASSELLFWLSKARSDSFADILGPEVFRAMITAMERDQFNEKKSSRLNDFLMNDKGLLAELIERADLEVVKDLTRALQHASCFEDMDKRSLLARIVKSYPAVQSMISGDQETREKGLIVSWKSLERRREEYESLVRKDIPANSKEIAVARSYGDLRENHEYKAAKEAQKILMTRKAELESELAMARGTDFSEVSADSVSIGTIVSVTDQSQNTKEDFTILGAWDSDPDRGFISYLSPLAQELLGHKPGEEITLAQHGGKTYLVNQIEKIPSKIIDDLAGEGKSKGTSKGLSDSENSPIEEKAEGQNG